MDFLYTACAFVVTLVILVSVHEFGHFWVARRCGVHVDRFSIGFGRPLFCWRDRHGTEFVVAMIPLGGYVKMVDSRVDELAADRRHLAFDLKPLRSRAAIVAAGPVANFLLAIVILWLVSMMGVQVVAPVVGDVQPDSAAAMAGLSPGSEILSVDSQRTADWNTVNMALLRSIGESRTLALTVRPFDQPEAPVQHLSIPVQNWLQESQVMPFRALGVSPWHPPTQAVLAEVVSGGPGSRAGLQPGDTVVEANGVAIDSWQQFVDQIAQSPKKEMAIVLKHAGVLRTVTVLPDAKRSKGGRVIGYLGVAVQPPQWPPGFTRLQRSPPLQGLIESVQRTASLTAMMLDTLGKLVTGRLSVNNIGGVISIGRAAGASAHSGLQSFLAYLAMLSISLGVLNILPIPTLDGGHLLYQCIELIRGKPLSEKIQDFATRVGFAVILGITFVAFLNDLARL